MDAESLLVELLEKLESGEVLNKDIEALGELATKEVVELLESNNKSRARQIRLALARMNPNGGYGCYVCADTREPAMDENNDWPRCPGCGNC